MLAWGTLRQLHTASMCLSVVVHASLAASGRLLVSKDCTEGCLGVASIKVHKYNATSFKSNVKLAELEQAKRGIVQDLRAEIGQGTCSKPSFLPAQAPRTARKVSKTGYAASVNSGRPVLSTS